MLIKTLGISQLVYSASNLNAFQGIWGIVKTKSFKFFWKNEKDKIRKISPLPRLRQRRNTYDGFWNNVESSETRLDPKNDTDFGQ